MTNNMLRILPLTILIVLPFIAFLNSLNNDFVYDDVFTVTDNYFIRDWGNFRDLFTSEYFKLSGEATYRPLVTISYFIDYSIGKLNPIGYHLTNLLSHAVAVILVYFITSAVIRKKTVSFMAGMFFSMHAILTETVNAISYREDLLTTVFFLGALLLFINSTKNFHRYLLLYPASLFLYLFALCSKEMAITLPLMVFLFDWILGDSAQIKKNAVRYYIGFLAVSIFYLLIRFVLLHNPAEGQLTYPEDSFFVNMLTMPKVVAAYIKLLFIPVHFNAEYMIAHTTTPLAPAFLCSMVFLCVAGIIACRFYFYSKPFFYFTVWFFVTLTPAMNILPIANIMAERYLYLPSVGFCIILALTIHSAWEKGCALLFFKKSDAGRKTTKGYSLLSGSKEAMVKQKNLPQTIMIVLLIAIPVIPYSVTTMHRNRCWRDQFIFWSTTVQDSPYSARAHNNLGMIYFGKGDIDPALHEFQTSVSLEADPEYRHNLGMAYQRKGMQQEAMQEYLLVLGANPDSALTHNNMGNIFISLGNIDEGIMKFKEAIRLKPHYYDAHFNLGLALFKKGLLNDSIEEFRLAVKYEPDHPEVHSCLGTAYANAGMIEESIRAYNETLRLQPNYITAYKNLGMVYLTYKKDIQRSIAYFQEFLKRNPDGDEAAEIRRTIEKIQAAQKTNK
ncbi:MAG: tetratricopeptide repeat protein [Candidatus Kuenenia stuttgartiensis]|nr:tetratricopeptide repeat protein [Candidatus Kuenenia stuttgartiensis]